MAVVDTPDPADLVAGAPPEADHTTLRLVHLSAPPDLSALEVKLAADRPLLGATATVRVIGSSHCLSLPAYDFHELCSCRPLPDVGVTVREAPADAPGDGPPEPDGTTVRVGRVRRVPLSPGVEREVATTTGGVRARTELVGLRLDAFPEDREFDVHYQFAPDAVTAVDVEDDRFETFHTYPEFDLAVRSVTTLSPVDA